MKTHVDTPALPHSRTAYALRRLTHTWPGWLSVFALAIGLMSIGRNAHAEEWTFHCEQSLLTVGAAIQNSPSHPQNPFPGQTRVIRVRPVLTTWGYNESNEGNIELDVQNTVPAPQPTIEIQGLSGPGMSWTMTTTGQDEQGYDYTDYYITFDESFINPNTVTIYVYAVFDNAGTNESVTASSDITFTPPAATDETWTKASDEGIFVTSLSGVDTTLQPNESIQIGIHGEFQSWEVWTSDYDRTEFRNQETAPASGAAVYLYGPYTLGWTAGVPGIVTGTPAQLDTEGNASFTYTMSAEGSDNGLTVYLEYGEFGSGSGLYFYVPPPTETWEFTRIEGSISASLTANGSVTNLQVNDTRNLTTTVTYKSWELWTSSFGRTEKRNESTAPAFGATVDWSIMGNGVLTPGPPSTGPDGLSTAGFLMGNMSSQVRADVSFLGCESVSTTLDLTVPVAGEWQADHEDSALAVNLTATSSNATAALTGQVSYQTWTVYRHTGTGATENRNFASATAASAQLTWGVGGAGVTASGDTSSNVAGGFSGSAVLGIETGTIIVTASFNGLSASATANVDACTLDTDGDGFTDAEEDLAGSDKIDPSSTPGGSPGPGEKQHRESGLGVETSYKVERQVANGTHIEYSDTSGSTQSIEAGIGVTRAEVAASLSITEEQITKFETTYHWEIVSQKTTTSGQHASAFVPMASVGYNFSRFVITPVDQVSSTVSEEVYLEPTLRASMSQTAWTWSCIWAEVPQK